jgi:hypothetical protein
MKNQFKENYQLAIEALKGARSDHYDGVNAIYRLAGCIKLSGSITLKQLENHVNKLAILPVRPNRCFVHDNILEIEWHPKGFQMVMNQEQYKDLILEFVEFLDEAPLPLLVQQGFLQDDPEASVKSVSNDLVNFYPKFNQNCFGSDNEEPIEILDIVCSKIFYYTPELN